MKIEEIGGEFALIDKLSKIIPADHADLIVGVGDDAAVIRTAPEPAPYLLVTTDILVEGRHFAHEWAGPEQIGIKAAECNISDIAAMGGAPTWMFVSLVLKKDAEVSWIERIYAGISLSCKRHGVIVAGGDTTEGPANTINIALLGTVSESHLCLRSHAQPGDLLAVTGPLGASAAALALLLQGRTPSGYLLDKHLAPTCRRDVVDTIAPVANAMIDISDGLGSEVHHICTQSQVSAEIYAHAVPLHDEVKAAGEVLNMAPLRWALSGGEDFELLFSIPEEKMKILETSGLTFYRLGRITEKQNGPVLITTEDGTLPLPGGYNHFKQ
ncbi:MAG: thiamine-phosphate kinase [Desulfobacteraceae bacterium]